MVKLVALVLVVARLMGAGAATGAGAASCYDASGLYAHCGVVVTVNHEVDLVVIEDFNGECWVQEGGAEDWDEGDIVAMLMSDSGTPDDTYDDEIVEMWYQGWVER